MKGNGNINKNGSDLNSAANDPQTANDPESQMIPDVGRKWSPPENEEWHVVCFSGQGFNF